MITHERTQAQLRNVICDASREDLQNHKLGEYVLLGSFLARCNLKLPDKKRASSKSAVAPSHLPHEADPIKWLCAMCILSTCLSFHLVNVMSKV